MDYIKLLKLTGEPFSNSPDPKYFFHSQRALDCLQRLEISIRLRRGLNIILGDVGTGKTTLSRALIQRFQSETDEFKFHLIIDPSFVSEHDFLHNLLKVFNITPPATKSSLAYKEAIRHFLLQEGVEKNKVIILIVDEAQKMGDENLEVLRSLLNFETNEFKLLQLVIFGQSEFKEKINQKVNFTDRIDTVYYLKALDEEETKKMIDFRIHQAGWSENYSLFTPNALKLIYLHTQGYPRKIINLCHHCLLTTLINKKKRVDSSSVNYIINDSKEQKEGNIRKVIIKPKKVSTLSICSVAGLSIILIISLIWGMKYLSPLISKIDLIDENYKSTNDLVKIEPNLINQTHEKENRLYTQSNILLDNKITHKSYIDKDITTLDTVNSDNISPKNTQNIIANELKDISLPNDNREITSTENSDNILTDSISNSELDSEKNSQNQISDIKNSTVNDSFNTETFTEDVGNETESNQDKIADVKVTKTENSYIENIETENIQKNQLDTKKNNISPDFVDENPDNITSFEVANISNEKTIQDHKIIKPSLDEDLDKDEDTNISKSTDKIIDDFDLVDETIETVPSFIKVRTKKGDNVSKMASRIYNTPEVSDEMIEKIANANPQISDLNRILVNEQIKFPILTIKPEHTEYTIRVGYFYDLEEAKECMNILRDSGYQSYMEREKFSDLGDRYKIMLTDIAELKGAKKLALKIRELRFPYAKVIKVK